MPSPGEDYRDSVMIALLLSLPDAQRVAIEGGLAPADLHVTVGFLGKAEELTPAVRQSLAEAVAATAAGTPGPLTGVFPAGFGVFAPQEPGGQIAFWAQPDVLGIGEMRDQLIQELRLRGVGELLHTDHEFTAHVTLAYLEPGEPQPDVTHITPGPISFQDLALVIGDDATRVAFPEGHLEQIVAAPVPKPRRRVSIPPGVDRVLTRMVREHNARVATSDRVRLPTARAVYARGVNSFAIDRNPGMTRDGYAFRRVDEFLSGIASQRLTLAQSRYVKDLQDADLLPRRTDFALLRPSLSAAAASLAAAGADDLVQMLASAAPMAPTSVRRRFTLSRVVAAARAGGAATALSLPALEALLADGNSRAARSARAKLQLRDRFGKWIEMGGGIRFKMRSPGSAGGGVWYHGTAVGIDAPNGLVQVKLDDAAGGGTVSVPARKVEKTIATLGASPKDPTPRDGTSEGALPERPAPNALIPGKTAPQRATLPKNDDEDDETQVPDSYLDDPRVLEPEEVNDVEDIGVPEVDDAAESAVDDVKAAIPDDSTVAKQRDELISRLKSILTELKDNGDPEVARADLRELVDNVDTVAKNDSEISADEKTALDNLADSVDEIAQAIPDADKKEPIAQLPEEEEEEEETPEPIAEIPDEPSDPLVGLPRLPENEDDWTPADYMESMRRDRLVAESYVDPNWPDDAKNGIELPEADWGEAPSFVQPAFMRRDGSSKPLTDEQGAATSYVFTPEFGPVNRALRGQEEGDDFTSEIISSLDSVMSDHETSQDLEVYRAVGASAVGDLQAGDNINDPAFLSTSLLKDVADSIASMDSTQRGDKVAEQQYVMTIAVPKGTKALYVPAITSFEEYQRDETQQYELLINRDTNLRITAVDHDNHTITAEIGDRISDDAIPVDLGDQEAEARLPDDTGASKELDLPGDLQNLLGDTEALRKNYGDGVVEAVENLSDAEDKSPENVQALAKKITDAINVADIPDDVDDVNQWGEDQYKLTVDVAKAAREVPEPSKSEAPDAPEVPEAPEPEVPQAPAPEVPAPEAPETPEAEIPEAPKAPEAEVPETPDAVDAPEAEVPGDAASPEALQDIAQSLHDLIGQFDNSEVSRELAGELKYMRDLTTTVKNRLGDGRSDKAEAAEMMQEISDQINVLLNTYDVDPDIEDGLNDTQTSVDDAVRSLIDPTDADLDGVQVPNAQDDVPEEDVAEAELEDDGDLDMFGDEVPEGFVLTQERQIGNKSVQDYEFTDAGTGDQFEVTVAMAPAPVETDAGTINKGDPVYVAKDKNGTPIGNFAEFNEAADAIEGSSTSPEAVDAEDVPAASPELDPLKVTPEEERQFRVDNNLDNADRPVPEGWTVTDIPDDDLVVYGPDGKDTVAFTDPNGTIALFKRPSATATYESIGTYSNWDGAQQGLDSFEFLPDAEDDTPKPEEDDGEEDLNLPEGPNPGLYGPLKDFGFSEERIAEIRALGSPRAIQMEIVRAPEMVGPRQEYQDLINSKSMADMNAEERAKIKRYTDLQGEIDTAETRPVTPAPAPAAPQAPVVPDAPVAPAPATPAAPPAQETPEGAPEGFSESAIAFIMRMQFGNRDDSKAIREWANGNLDLTTLPQEQRDRINVVFQRRLRRTHRLDNDPEARQQITALSEALASGTLSAPPAPRTPAAPEVPTPAPTAPEAPAAPAPAAPELPPAANVDEALQNISTAISTDVYQLGMSSSEFNNLKRAVEIATAANADGDQAQAIEALKVGRGLLDPQPNAMRSLFDNALSLMGDSSVSAPTGPSRFDDPTDWVGNPAPAAPSAPNAPAAPTPAPAAPGRPTGAPAGSERRYTVDGIITDRNGQELYAGMRVRSPQGDMGTILRVQQEPAYARVALDDGRVRDRSGRQLFAADSAPAPAPAPAAPAAPATPTPAVQATPSASEIAEEARQQRIQAREAAQAAQQAQAAAIDAAAAAQGGSIPGDQVSVTYRAWDPDLSDPTQRAEGRSYNGDTPGVTTDRSGLSPGRPLSRTQELNPDSFGEWENRAAEIAQAGNERGELSQILQALQNDPRDPDAISALEMAYGTGGLGNANKPVYTFGDRRMSVDVKAFYYPNSNAVSLMGTISDEQGNEIGNVHRKLYLKTDGTVSHAYNALMEFESPDERGGGFAAAYNRHMENWYIANGIPRVSVEAAGYDDYIGGYVWAINGFDFRDPSDGAMMLMGVEYYANASGVPGIDDEVANLKLKVASGAKIMPYELAMLGWRPGAKTWVGKQYMSNQTWMGNKELTPDSRSTRAVQNNAQFIAARERAKQIANAVTAQGIADKIAAGTFGDSALLAPHRDEIVRVLSEGRSLAELSPTAKKALQEAARGQLLNSSRNDQGQELLDVLRGLQSEYRLDHPDVVQLGPVQQVQDISWKDIQAGNHPGFTQKIIDEGVNARNSRSGPPSVVILTHAATGQRFLVKFDAHIVNRNESLANPLDTSADQEIWALDFLRNAGLQGTSHAVQHPEPGVVIQQMAGDSVELIDRPKNAADWGGSAVWQEALANLANPLDWLKITMGDALIGNEDRHQKNFQLGKDADGRWWVFPIDQGLSGNNSLGHGFLELEDLLAFGMTPDDAVSYALLHAFDNTNKPAGRGTGSRAWSKRAIKDLFSRLGPDQALRVLAGIFDEYKVALKATQSSDPDTQRRIQSALDRLSTDEFLRAILNAYR